MTASLVISIVAAAIGVLSALVAARGAAGVASLAHRVAAVDRDAAELREAYLKTVEAMSAVVDGDAGMPALGALEILASCRASDEDLDSVATHLQRVILSQDAEGAGNLMLKLRVEYRRIQARLEVRRDEILEEPKWRLLARKSLRETS